MPSTVLIILPFSVCLPPVCVCVCSIVTVVFYHHWFQLECLKSRQNVICLSTSQAGNGLFNKHCVGSLCCDIISKLYNPFFQQIYKEDLSVGREVSVFFPFSASTKTLASMVNCFIIITANLPYKGC